MEATLRKKLEDGRFKNVSATRSRTMGAIRGKHTKSTERVLRMILIRAGIKGWKLHARELPGNPDVYFPECKLAIFVDGCFWHGCPKCGHIPKTRSEFWRAKIRRNRARDRMSVRVLRERGINVIRIWEHFLKFPAARGRVLCRISDYITITGDPDVRVHRKPVFEA